MSRIGVAFIAIVWAAGAMAGIVIARAPALLPLPVPHFTASLIAALLLDLALLALGRPLVGMNERAAAVFGATLIGMGIGALVAP